MVHLLDLLAELLVGQRRLVELLSQRDVDMVQIEIPSNKIVLLYTLAKYGLILKSLCAITFVVPPQFDTVESRCRTRPGSCSCSSR